MSNVKWIKLSTNMPENRKIKRIRRLPDGNNVVLFWVFLLSKAGESNNSGGLFFLEDMPYTVDDLAEEFDFTHDFVNFALATLEKMQMIERYDEIVYIKNWEKYQSTDKLEKIREQTRKRVANHRNKNKEVALRQNVTLHVTQSNATEEDKELDKELDKEKEEIPYVEIINYLNDATGKKYRASTNKTKTCIKARWKEGFRLDDFKKVIDTKTSEWKNDSKMSQYLRPETLFGNKFEGYLNQQAEQQPPDPYDQLF